jgi:hypothetical protein
MKELSLVHVRECRFNLINLTGFERKTLMDAVCIHFNETGYMSKYLPTLSLVINALMDIS